MTESSAGNSTDRADLFAIPCGPLPPSDKLQEWPEDEAEAARLVAIGKRTGDKLRALLPAVRDMARWQEATVKVTTAIRYYLEAHEDAARDTDGGSVVYSDGFRRFVVALVEEGKPGEGMSLAEFSFATSVPEAVLKDWLNSRTGP